MQQMPIISLNKQTPSSMGDVFKTLQLSDDNEIFRGYIDMIEMYNALKFQTLLFSIQKI